MLLEQIEIELADQHFDRRHTVYIDVYDNSLSRKWLSALNVLLAQGYYLEKNYCWFGFADGPRTAEYICEQINHSIEQINQAQLGYTITDHFSVANTIQEDLDVNHEKMNHLHRYFEDLQGVSGQLSPYYLKATAQTRWHIRQLNLLCHEYESLVLSMRKKIEAPEWQRPSQLMCWLNAPRFALDEQDYELFGIETLNRSLGGVYVGVNKAVGKHHWEVFNDEGRDSRIGELTTTTLRSQTEAAGDFDIEWANNPGEFYWQKIKLKEFREWLTNNGFDPEDKNLTIGHPKVGQVDLIRSFGTTDYQTIWNQLAEHLNVAQIKTSTHCCEYNYNWTDDDYVQRQIAVLGD